MNTAPVQLSADQFAALLGRLSTGDTGNASRASVKPVRPTVDVEASESEWQLFDDHWKRYKRMAKLATDEEIRDNLRQCCTEHLNKRLFDIWGGAALNSVSEDNLLKWIKDIAVKGVHKEVHRTQFVKLRQKQGESINSYYGRLKAESSLCELKVSAPATCEATDCECVNHGVQVSYQDDLVATQLIAGLYNAEHQAKILSEGSALPSLNDKLQRLIVLERSDASLSSLNAETTIRNSHSNVTRGEFQRNDRSDKSRRKVNRRSGQKYNNQRNDGSKQDGAGKDGAGNGDGARNDGSDGCRDCGRRHARCRSCQGYHKCTSQCNSCKGMGHIRSCCPTGDAASVNMAAAPAATLEGTPTLAEEHVVCFHVSGVEVFEDRDRTKHQAPRFGDSPADLDNFKENFSVPSTVAPPSSVELPPHLSTSPADPLPVASLNAFPTVTMEPLLHMEFVNKEFQRTTPKNAPMLQVSCKLLLEVHARYGKLLQGKKRPRPIDTPGLADTGAQICTGGSDLLSALGIDASFLVLTGMSVSGIGSSRVHVLGALFLEVSSNGRCTRQIVYIASKARQLILSEKALKDLGVIPENFPCAGMFTPGRDHQTAVRKLAAKPPDVPIPDWPKNDCGCFVRAGVPPLPTKLPFEDAENRRKELEKRILNYYTASAFNPIHHWGAIWPPPDKLLENSKLVRAGGLGFWHF